MGWTPERVELLKNYWAEGLSASQIAAQLSGATRNAVIGKVHRLGLSGRAKPAARGPRKRRLVPPSPAAFPRSGQTNRIMNAALRNAKIHFEERPVQRRPIENLAVPTSLRLGIAELTDDTCKWPIGDPSAEDFHFCGHKHFDKFSYCEYHTRVAYQPFAERRQDRRTREYREQQLAAQAA